MNKINFVWTLNPTTGPVQYGLTTSKEASKIQALAKVAEELGISLNNALGVGDTLGDWEFMNLCGHVATMADASDQLKKLVKSKKEGKFLIAPSVNDDGILKVFDFFLK